MDSERGVKYTLSYE